MVEAMAEEVADKMTEEMAAPAEGWSVIQKGLLFFIVIGAVGFYVRWAKRRDNGGYRKPLA